MKSLVVSPSALAVAVLTVAAVIACNKPDAAPPAPSATTSAAPPPVASSAPAASSAPVIGSAAPAETASAPAASGSVAAAGSAEASSCGAKGLPDCPLQAWMKANVSPAMTKNDAPAIGAALDKIAGFAPAGYTNWVSISKDGAAAAKSGDMSAAKASCRSCHDQYKAKYKAEMRTRKI